MSNKKLTNIELFAGAGGLTLGLEEAGFEAICINENNHLACETLRLNRPQWNVIEDDIKNVSFKEYYNEVDLVSGGCPCQAFSHAGKRLGFSDTRGTLFYEFARCVKETNAKMFLFENVKGLLTHDEGYTFSVICSCLEQLGYETIYKVLNASLFGVPQKRERVILLGIRKDLADKVELKDIYPTPSDKPMTLREGLKNVPDSPYIDYSENKKKVMALVPEGGCWVDLPPAVAEEYMGKAYHSSGGRRGYAKRLSWSEPSPTLTTSPSQKQTERCHPTETRPLTVREYARIQSFPDDWEFVGTLSQQYKQIGNAVPVELAKRVGQKLYETLETL